MLRQLALLTILLAIPASVAAHGAAFSIVEINKESGTANPVFDDASPTQLTLPKEYAPKSYVVGENITFSADLSDGGQWNFGDGTKPVSGKSVIHRYTKTGTYAVTLSDEETVLTTIAISIVPTVKTTFPTANIMVNDKLVASLLLDTIEVKPGKEVVFDASASGDIVSYQWDFGDGSGGNGKTVTHTYKRDAFFPVYVILRATDKNGVFVDAFVTLDTPLTSPNALENLIEAIKEFFANLFAKQS